MKKYKLYYYFHPMGNVGDDLNKELWQSMIPGMLDGEIHHEDPANASLSIDTPLFLGIGTILNAKVPINPKIIFGSGTGYGDKFDATHSEVLFVRGPMSADSLGISQARWITDPAILISRLIEPAVEPGEYASFIPHIDTDTVIDWLPICTSARVNYISPRWHWSRVCANVVKSKVVMCQAMHGAIFADSLRVPWVPVDSGGTVHHFKWNDWTQSLSLTLKWEQINHPWEGSGFFHAGKHMLKAHAAVNDLSRLSGMHGLLSSDAVFQDRLAAVVESAEALKMRFQDDVGG